MKILINIIMELDFNLRSTGKFSGTKSREVCFRNITLFSTQMMNWKWPKLESTLVIEASNHRTLNHNSNRRVVGGLSIYLERGADKIFIIDYKWEGKKRRAELMLRFLLRQLKGWWYHLWWQERKHRRSKG